MDLYSGSVVSYKMQAKLCGNISKYELDFMVNRLIFVWSSLLKSNLRFVTGKDINDLITFLENGDNDTLDNLKTLFVSNLCLHNIDEFCNYVDCVYHYYVDYYQLHQLYGAELILNKSEILTESLYHGKDNQTLYEKDGYRPDNNDILRKPDNVVLSTIPIIYFYTKNDEDNYELYFGHVYNNGTIEPGDYISKDGNDEFVLYGADGNGVLYDINSKAYGIAPEDSDEELDE